MVAVGGAISWVQEQIKTAAEVGLDQKTYLEAMSEGADEGMMVEDKEHLQKMVRPEVVDCTDPFLLNEQNLEPKQLLGS